MKAGIEVLSSAEHPSETAECFIQALKDFEVELFYSERNVCGPSRCLVIKRTQLFQMAFFTIQNLTIIALYINLYIASLKLSMFKLMKDKH